MKKVPYRLIAIMLLAVWVVDLLSFFEFSEVWIFVKGIYLVLGIPFIILFFCEAFENENKPKETKKSCSICGETIMTNEKSKHIAGEKNYDSVDYCEKCVPKVSGLK